MRQWSYGHTIAQCWLFGERVVFVVRVTFVDQLGGRRELDAASGYSLMDTAVKRAVPGIIGECGGNASCGTCHVYVDPEFLDRLAPPGELEEDLLDLGVTDRRANSRLACQIQVTEDLDGIVVQTPASQG